MAQRESHAHEVEGGIRIREPLAQATHQRNAEVARLLEHAGARIESDDASRRAHRRQRLACHQPRAGGDVEHAHAGLEAAALQRLAAVASAGAEGKQALDEIVVARGAVEEPVDEAAPVAFAGPILGQHLDRCARGGFRGGVLHGARVDRNRAGNVGGILHYNVAATDEEGWVRKGRE